MYLWLTAVTNDELAELAARLPAGRGMPAAARLCYIKGELYFEPLGTALDDEPWPPPDPGPAKSCRAAGTRLRQVMSSSRAIPSSAAGGRR